MKTKIPTWMVVIGIIIIAMFLFGGKDIFITLWDIFDPVDATITINSLSMSSGCSGNVIFAPTTNYPLEVCIGTVCVTKTSGEYGAGSSIAIPGAPEGTQTLKFTWKRVKDPSARYDRGESASSSVNDKCYSTSPWQYCQTSVWNSSTCTGETVSIYTAPCAHYSGSVCTGDLFINEDVLPSSSSCRIYEGYTRSGGVSATYINYACNAFKSTKDGMDICRQYPDPNPNTYYATTKKCTPGTPASCPTSICTYAQGTSSTSITMFGTGSTTSTLSGNVVASLSVSWIGAPTKADGQTCTSASECIGGYCIHSICRSTATYCGDIFCDSGETSSNCLTDCTMPLKANGQSCTTGTECSSGFCVHSVCRATSPFCGDTFCDSGETSSSCIADCPLLPNGAACTANSECASNYCVHNTCRSSSTYCGDAYCDSGETCTADCAIILKADGQSCTANSECSSTFCINSVCAAKTADSDNDLLFNSFENLTTKTDPADADTDNDGMPDGWEYLNGLNPLVNDANLDLNVNGITNIAEYTAGTNPCSTIGEPPLIIPPTTTTTPSTTAAGVTPGEAAPTGFFGEITKRLSIFWIAIIAVIAVIYFIGTKKKGKK